MSSIQDIVDYRIPTIRNKKLVDPHVVIVGAGASKAACATDKRNCSVPLLKNILEVLSVDELLLKYGFIAKDISDFEEFYSDIYGNPIYEALCLQLECEVYNYFSKLELPDDVNLYDYLILSLTSKDLIISFNWDPFLLQAYRRNIEVSNLPQLAFLHGNVGVGICNTCRVKGYYGYDCPECYSKLEKMPLLYPIGQKDYNSNSVIRNEWRIAEEYLHKAAGVTIFGYGAPFTDNAAVELLKQALQKSNTKVICPVTIINLFSVKEEQLKKWSAFYDPTMTTYVDKFQDTMLWQNPRVSLETLFDAILQQHPRGNFKSLKNFSSLTELQEFIQTINEFELWLPEGSNDF